MKEEGPDFLLLWEFILHSAVIGLKKKKKKNHRMGSKFSFFKCMSQLPGNKLKENVSQTIRKKKKDTKTSETTGQSLRLKPWLLNSLQSLLPHKMESNLGVSLWLRQPINRYSSIKAPKDELLKGTNVDNVCSRSIWKFILVLTRTTISLYLEYKTFSRKD